MKTMMKIVAAMLIAVMLLTGAAMAAGKIRTTGDVNVRKGAGLDYGSVRTVKAGKVLNFDKTKKDARGVIWYHVTDGKTGWVSSRFTAQIEGSVSKDAKAAKATGKTVKATGDLYLRKGPGLGYAETVVMKTGKTASYLGQSKKDNRGVAWYKVSFNGKTGWVSSRYSKLVK